MSWAAARVYHLLAEEKLCPATMRRRPTGSPLRFSSRDEFSSWGSPGRGPDRCGWDVLGDLGESKHCIPIWAASCRPRPHFPGRAATRSP